jgi:hypothetical protein
MSHTGTAGPPRPAVAAPGSVKKVRGPSARFLLVAGVRDRAWMSPAASTRQAGPFHHRRLCCPAGRPVLRPSPTPSERPARFPAPHRLCNGALPRALRARFGRGGPLKSLRHLLNVPRPLRWTVPRGFTSRTFTTSMASAVIPAARHCLIPNDAAGFASPLRTAQLLPSFEKASTLGSGQTRFQTGSPACHWAPWRLPGPDLHRLAMMSFRSGHDRWTTTADSLGARTSD